MQKNKIKERLIACYAFQTNFFKNSNLKIFKIAYKQEYTLSFW